MHYDDFKSSTYEPAPRIARFSRPQRSWKMPWKDAAFTLAGIALAFLVLSAILLPGNAL